MNKMGDFWDLFHPFYVLIEKKNKSIENTRKRGKIAMSSVKVKFSHILILVGGNATLVTLYQD